MIVQVLQTKIIVVQLPLSDHVGQMSFRVIHLAFLHRFLQAAWFAFLNHGNAMAMLTVKMAPMNPLRAVKQLVMRDTSSVETRNAFLTVGFVTTRMTVVTILMRQRTVRQDRSNVP